MYQRNATNKSTPTTEITQVHPQAQAVQSPTPALDDRFSYSFKSLFTLADVAAKRRANGSFKKSSPTDENAFCGSESASANLMPLKRSKSGGDVTVLGDKYHCSNAAAGRDKSKPVKGLRSRAATTPQASPSRIPKAKSVAWLQSADTTSKAGTTNSSSQLSALGALKVDDALFVMVTPPQTPKKLLTLAAHAPSLPRVASPFSPRTTNESPPAKSTQAYHPPPRSSPTTGHTNASLHLTKSHWEFRYETWSRSHCTQHLYNMTETTQLTSSRSGFPAESLANPALFPRAGSLTPTALRPVLDGTVVGEDARPALELDWAMRGWSLDKIQRALFIHDLDVRLWFPIDENLADTRAGSMQDQETGTELELERTTSTMTGSFGDGQENECLLRRWEWDWELRWKVIESMAEHQASTKAECEYDVFLAEEIRECDRVQGECETDQGNGMGKGDWEWNEDAMEVDAIL